MLGSGGGSGHGRSWHLGAVTAFYAGVFGLFGMAGIKRDCFYPLCHAINALIFLFFCLINGYFGVFYRFFTNF